MKKLLILKCGQTFISIKEQHGDFDDMIIKASGISKDHVLVVEVFKKCTFPELNDIAAIIITGSHAMVTHNEKWSVELSAWLKDIAIYKIPTLGICYGHQLLAKTFGGKVDNHPLGVEIGSVNITLTEEGMTDSVFKHLPQSFSSYVTHYQSVIKLPKKATLLAGNQFEPHHAFEINNHIWGVQFHPEFTASITHRYIEEQRDQLVRDGFNIEELHATVAENEFGQNLLQAFLAGAGLVKKVIA